MSAHKLLIVESPSKAKTIEKYLGGEYRVRASIGHIRDLPKSNKKAIDIEAGFVPTYEISKGKEKVIDELRREAEKAQEIILAPDPDREGEAIAWHLSEILHQDKKVKAPIKRVTFHEITKDAVTEALQHPRSIDMNLKTAQEARRVLDRLFGYDLSGLIWKKVRYGLSAGRVQSPALRILMEREREIRSFIPETYWVISGLFETPKKEQLTLTCSEEPRDHALVDRIMSEGKTGTWKVVDVKETEVKRSPRPPFTTSTLQQTASSRLGFSPKRTMIAAQKLYEAGHITYMRTDSTTLAKSAQAAIAAAIEAEHGKQFVQVRNYQTKSKNAQEAHEAIRPTHIHTQKAGTTDDQKKLYSLIWERAVASQMVDARVARTKISASVGTKDFPEFAATGSRVIFPGWLLVDTEARGEDMELPKVAVDETLALLELTDTEKQTQPPSRYTEAGLVKELEARGIGRPSTYASIMSTLEERGYVTKEGRTLIPTDTGDVVSSFLEKHFGNYISDTFTADMENELDELANGEREYVKTLKEFYTPFTKDVKAKDKLEKLTTIEAADPKFKCPKCESSMVVKLGRGGKFLSCARYPDCDGALTITGEELPKDKVLGTDPETGLEIKVMTGRFGPYVQLGEKPPKGAKKKKGEKIQKPKMSSIPKGTDPTTVTLEMALKYLSIPRTLGLHPETSKEVTANNGRFGPYVAHDGNFRSIKPPLDVYTITLDQALELLAQEKKPRGFQRKKVK